MNGMPPITLIRRLDWLRGEEVLRLTTDPLIVVLLSNAAGAEAEADIQYLARMIRGSGEWHGDRKRSMSEQRFCKDWSPGESNWLTTPSGWCLQQIIRIFVVSNTPWGRAQRGRNTAADRRLIPAKHDPRSLIFGKFPHESQFGYWPFLQNPSN